MAALVATAVSQGGERRIVGLDLAAGNDEGWAWPALIRSLVEVASAGVRLLNKRRPSGPGQGRP